MFRFKLAINVNLMFGSGQENVLTKTKRSINGHSEPILNAIVNVI